MFYHSFILLMASSPGFGSTTPNYSPYLDSLSLRLQAFTFNLARYRNSPVHSTKGTPSLLNEL